jgi:rhodanese-related sulfurtransferase
MRPNQSVPAVDVQTAAERLAGTGPPLLVDVREPDEFQTVRVEGAVLLPLSSFGVRYDELPRDRAVLIMCAGGGRSAAATAHLLASGWPDVTNMTGGIIAWERSGLPVRRGTPEPGEGDLPAD